MSSHCILMEAWHIWNVHLPWTIWIEANILITVYCNAFINIHSERVGLILTDIIAVLCSTLVWEKALKVISTISWLCWVSGTSFLKVAVAFKVQSDKLLAYFKNLTVPKVFWESVHMYMAPCLCAICFFSNLIMIAVFNYHWVFVEHIFLLCTVYRILCFFSPHW